MLTKTPLSRFILVLLVAVGVVLVPWGIGLIPNHYGILFIEHIGTPESIYNWMEGIIVFTLLASLAMIVWGIVQIYHFIKYGE